MNSRDKGKRGELEVVHYWHDLDFKCWRTPNSGGLTHSKGDINGVPGLHQEVKMQETVRIKEWIRQADEDCSPTDIPVVIWRTSRMPWRVDLELSDFGPIWKHRVSS